MVRQDPIDGGLQLRVAAVEKRRTRQRPHHPGDAEENLYLCQWNSGKVPPYKLHRLP